MDKNNDLIGYNLKKEKFNSKIILYPSYNSIT